MTRAGSAEYSNASMSLAQYFMSLFCAGEFLDHRFAHCNLLNLAGHGRRKTVDEADIARNLVVGDPLLTEPADSFLVEIGAGSGDDPGTEFFAVFGVRYPEHLDVLNIGMAIQIFFDFARIDVFAAADDHVLDPSDD